MNLLSPTQVGLTVGAANKTISLRREPDMMKIKSFESNSVEDNKDLGNTLHERRRHKRFDVQQMRLSSEMPSASLVKVMNISGGGVLVMADRVMNAGNKYSLKIGYKDKVLFVKTIAKWSSLIETVEDADGNIIPIYVAGMQFTDVIKGDIQEIIRLVEADMQSTMYNASMESLLESTQYKL